MSTIDPATQGDAAGVPRGRFGCLTPQHPDVGHPDPPSPPSPRGAHKEPAGATSKPTTTTLQPGCGAPPPPHTTLAGCGEAGRALTRAVAVGAAAARHGVQRGRRSCRHGAELRLAVSPHRAVANRASRLRGQGEGGEAVAGGGAMQRSHRRSHPSAAPRQPGGRAALRCCRRLTPLSPQMLLLKPLKCHLDLISRLIWDGLRKRALNRVNKACIECVTYQLLNIKS